MQFSLLKAAEGLLHANINQTSSRLMFSILGIVEDSRAAVQMVCHQTARQYNSMTAEQSFTNKCYSPSSHAVPNLGTMKLNITKGYKTKNDTEVTIIRACALQA